jgi:hypothetical protein
MHLRIQLAAAGAAAALAVFAGVVYAAPASASLNYLYMCVDSLSTSQADHIGCPAVPPPPAAGALVVDSYEIGKGNYNFWDWPPSSGQISVYNNGAPGVLCMTVDASASLSIDLQPCAGLKSQEWTTKSEQNSAGNTIYLFVSKYDSYCLNDDYYYGYYNVAPCGDGAFAKSSADEQFFIALTE